MEQGLYYWRAHNMNYDNVHNPSTLFKEDVLRKDKGYGSRKRGSLFPSNARKSEEDSPRIKAFEELMDEFNDKA